MVKYFAVSGKATKDKAAEDVSSKAVKIHVFDYPTVV